MRSRLARQTCRVLLILVYFLPGFFLLYSSCLFCNTSKRLLILSSWAFSSGDGTQDCISPRCSLTIFFTCWIVILLTNSSSFFWFMAGATFLPAWLILFSPPIRPRRMGNRIGSNFMMVRIRVISLLKRIGPSGNPDDPLS